MKKIILLILCTAVLMGQHQRGDSRQMPAIGILQGTVLDSSKNNPIEYASVSIINVRSNNVVTGAVTDAKGHFYISEIPLGKYTVMIEFIGYNKAIIESINLFPGKGGGSEHNLGYIQLASSAILMTEVDVVGEAPQLTQTIDKQIFRLDQSLTTQGGTASDALQKIPNVDVDIDGNISLRGDQNVTVLIDGKPSGMTHGDRRAVVDNIPAAMIDRVEVITNPSAKYDPDGMGGIINIILKRGMFEGLNGNTSVSVGEYGKFNASGMVNYRVKNWNLTANGSYRKGNRYGEGGREFNYIYSNPDSLSVLEQQTLRNRFPEDISLRVGGDYYLGSKNMFSLTTTFDTHDNRTENTVDYISPELEKILTLSWDIGTHWDYVIRYDRDFDRDEQDFIVDITYNTSVDESIEEQAEDGDNIGEEHNHNEDDGHTHANEHNSNLVISSDYTHPFSHNTIIEAGFKSTLKSFNTDLEYLFIPYLYSYSEDVHAAYATFSHQMTDRIGLKLGLRAEQVYTTADVAGESNTSDSTNIFTAIIDIAVKESPFDNPYFQLYPSVFLLVDMNENSKIQFGYGKRVNRPRRRSLNPFPRNTADFNHIRNGNPYLKPEFIDAFEFNFLSNTRKITFNTGIAFKKVTQMIQWWDRDQIVFDEQEYEVLTADNAGFSEQFNGNMMINFRPMPLFNFTFNIYGWKSSSTGSGESDLNAETHGFAGFSSLNMTIPKVARLELSGRFRGRMKITYGHIPASAMLDLGIQKSFLNRRLSLTFKIKDVFKTAKFTIYTEQEIESTIGQRTYVQTMDAWRQRDRRTLSLVLNYNFGKVEQKRGWNKKGMGRGNGGGGMEMDY